MRPDLVVKRRPSVMALRRAAERNREITEQRQAEFLEDYRDLRDSGENRAGIARRLGITECALERREFRAIAAGRMARDERAPR